jgi:hypothetical protein
MSELRVVSLDSLLQRLEQILGADSLLLKRFQQGLQREDEQRLAEAMAALKLYPAKTQGLVEDTMMSWLFGGQQVPDQAPLDARPRR